MAMAKGLSCQR